MKRLPGRRWCPVSQSPADGPEPEPEPERGGGGSAARRLRAHADYVEVMAVAEFGRLRAEQLEASRARGDRVRSRDGEYPAEELGFEMTASAYSAAILIHM